MYKIDPAVSKETRFVSAFVLILSMLMEAVFLLIGKWDITVLWGNLLSASVSILNFFLLGISITRAMQRDEKQLQAFMRLSKTYRFLLIIVVIGVGIYFDCFNNVAVIVPVFFPTIAIYIRGALLKKQAPAAPAAPAEGGKADEL